MTTAKKRHWYPFNAEQTINILSEFGPLVTMFVVNAIAGIHAGTWALIISTVIAMIVMRLVLGRLPVFPIIASGVTIIFGVLTLLTGDPMWVQIKVSIFNAMFGGFLFGGLWATSSHVRDLSWKSVAAITAVLLMFQLPYVDLAKPLPALGDNSNPLSTNLFCIASMIVGFLLGGLVFRKNFFGHVFERTFRYSQEGWDRFTFSFAWFFIFTAILNEFVRQTWAENVTYDVLGYPMTGVEIWIAFKIVGIMPLSGLYAWLLTQLMASYQLPEPEHVPARNSGPLGAPRPGAQIAREPGA
ncbi:MAG: septation protein IspZ [Hyphomicrobium sp.]|nr:septation protein IspZ [Hyphomicrobium sp.]